MRRGGDKIFGNLIVSLQHSILIQCLLPCPKQTHASVSQLMNASKYEQSHYHDIMGGGELSTISSIPMYCQYYEVKVA